MLLRALLPAVAAAVAFAAANAPIDFQKEVRPILSNVCFQCHGFDQATRMAGLRLDTKDGAFAERKSGRAIVAGDLNASLLWQRIDNENAAKRMPPAYSHKSLTPEQKSTLKLWIEQGAPWKEHWAFAAPVRRELPPVRNKDWSRNPIDRFILARLEAEGFAPAPEADRRTLARRLSFDLTGLPPDPRVVEAFLSDTSSDAYEKLVDQFLAMPQWGEHRARYWLDAARYADSHGIHIDNFREMWPYRDWVIRAFNRNQTFDQFTLEQIAGDLLPNRTLDQWVATGFHRCNATTNEGGVIPEEFEAIYAKDRVDTTGTVFLGLTVGCATCHDHKFDPILQREVYQLAAFFRNTTQQTLDGNIRDTAPVVFVPPFGEEAKWEKLVSDEQRLRGIERQEARAESMGRFEKWISRTKLTSAPRSPVATSDEDFVLTENLPRAAGVEWKSGARGPQLEFFSKGKIAVTGGASKISADKPFTISTWFYLPANKSAQVLASHVIAGDKEEDKTIDNPRESRNGWILEMSGARPQLTLLGDEHRGRISIRSKEELKRGTWNHVSVSYDGSRRWDGLTMYIGGERVEPARSNDWKPLAGSIGNDRPLLLGSNGADRDFNGGALEDFRILLRSITDEEAALLAAWSSFETARLKPPPEWTTEQRDAAATYYRVRIDTAARAKSELYEQVAAEKLALERRGGLTHVQVEKPEAPFAHVLNRGMYDQPREKVTPDVPGVLPPMAADLPRNRLGLAKWLIAPENPLLSRVTVNRFWQEVFGTGIVRTAEDFGSQGEAPSHPELLDWLAVEFRESGWDVKRLFRLMVTSATYRQQGLTTPEKIQKDPQNRLLARGPRFRMDGEEVRDLALAASGLLNGKIGGPSAKPYQPSNVWETVAMNDSDTRFYVQDHGDALYRRSMYTFWKRSAPPPSMDIFNAPTREQCTVRRERTNTPLQALVVMNDPQFVEAARMLAQNAMTASHDADSRIDYMTARILSRPFDPAERGVIKRELKDLLQHYDSHLADAKRLLATGESKVDAKLSAPEFAAWTMIASSLLNLDEALNQ
jgi:hypothetical protein